MHRIRVALALVALVFATSASAQQVGPLPDIQHGTIALHLNPVATGLGAPDYGISPPGDGSRLFVLEQKGTILVLQNGVLLPAPALDIQARVSPPLVPTNANDERGLLGLAFHPGFNDPASPGYHTLYTYHSEVIPVGTTPTFPTPTATPPTLPAQNYKNVVAEWKISAADPNVIDPASRREVVSFAKNAGNHNGGTITFGPDGYAYLALGDGGNANDVGPSHHEPGGNAQWLETPLGKMLRFDPIHPSLTPSSTDPISANGEYRIPASNPFSGPNEVREIFAYGFRNPYRFSFDSLTGDLIVADVGQNQIEEVDRVTIGGNWGWAVKEGTFPFNRTNGTIGADSPGVPAGLTDPIHGSGGYLEYDHSDGISITGGFVYRGSAIPQLYGKYVCGDLAIRNAPPRVDGRLFYMDFATGDIREFLLPDFPNDQMPNQVTVHGFGQDATGELYAMVTNTPSSGTGGIVYKLEPMAPVATVLTAFTALAEPGAVRLHWSFQDPSEFVAVRVERSGAMTGPWSEIAAGQIRLADGGVDAVDRTVTAAATYWYRLVGTDRAGAVTEFAPIVVTTEAEFARAAITRVAPNPGAGPVDVEFVLPRAGDAGVRVLDLQGRVVASLASGARAAGRHHVSWDGLGLRGPVAAGLYLVELSAAGARTTQRIAIVR